MNDVTNTCLLSIIVPVYNSEKYLRDCLDSLLLQNIPMEQYEIICVDDGATDSSPRILDEYAKKHANIRVIHKENGGVSSARNVGIDHANGEYVWFVDSDDCIRPNCLKRISELLVEHRPEMIHFSYLEVSEDFDFSMNNDNDELIALYHDSDEAHGCLYSACLAITRLDLINENGIRFEQDIRYGEDAFFQFLVYISLQKPIMEIRNELYYYRKVSTSAMHAKNEKNLVDRLNNSVVLARKYSELLDDSRVNNSAIRKSIAEQRKWYATHIALLILPHTSLSISQTVQRLRTERLFPCHILWMNITQAKTAKQKLTLIRNSMILRFSLFYFPYSYLIRKQNTNDS